MSCILAYIGVSPGISPDIRLTGELGHVKDTSILLVVSDVCFSSSPHIKLNVMLQHALPQVIRDLHLTL